MIKLEKISEFWIWNDEVIRSNYPVASRLSLLKAAQSERMLQGLHVTEEDIVAEMSLLVILKLQRNVLHFVAMKALLTIQWICFHLDVH